MMRAVFTVLMAVGLAGSAFAQDSTVVVGGSASKSSVTVDLSVLDALGAEPTVPDMMLIPGRRGNFQPTTPLGRRTLAPPEEFEPTAPPSGGVTLRPPGGAAPRAETLRPPAAPKAKTPTRASKQATRSRPATQVARSTLPPPTLPPAPALTPPPEAPPAPAPSVAVPSLSSPSQPPAPAPSQATRSPAASSQVASAPPAPSAPATSAAPTRSGPEFVGPTMPSAPSAPPASTSLLDRSPAAAPPPAAPAPTAPSRAAPAPSSSPSTQTASLPPAGQISLPFSGEDATLADPAKRQLDALAARAGRDETLRLQLLAYASGTGDAASRARRVSLSRALAVRSYLIDKGVRSTRIDVRALGNRVEGGDPDRVDVIVSGR